METRETSEVFKYIEGVATYHGSSGNPCGGLDETCQLRQDGEVCSLWVEWAYGIASAPCAGHIETRRKDVHYHPIVGEERPLVLDIRRSDCNGLRDMGGRCQCGVLVCIPSGNDNMDSFVDDLNMEFNSLPYFIWNARLMTLTFITATSNVGLASPPRDMETTLGFPVVDASWMTQSKPATLCSDQQHTLSE